MIDGTAPEALTNWLIHAAWPLWLEHGIDRRAGGFHEALDPAGYVCHEITYYLFRRNPGLRQRPVDTGAQSSEIHGRGYRSVIESLQMIDCLIECSIKSLAKVRVEFCHVASLDCCLRRGYPNLVVKGSLFCSGILFRDLFSPQDL